MFWLVLCLFALSVFFIKLGALSVWVHVLSVALLATLCVLAALAVWALWRRLSGASGRRPDEIRFGVRNRDF
jgi:hypothetical protein